MYYIDYIIYLSYLISACSDLSQQRSKKAGIGRNSADGDVDVNRTGVEAGTVEVPSSVARG